MDPQEHSSTADKWERKILLQTAGLWLLMEDLGSASAAALLASLCPSPQTKGPLLFVQSQEIRNQLQTLWGCPKWCLAAQGGFLPSGTPLAGLGELQGGECWGPGSTCSPAPPGCQRQPAWCRPFASFSAWDYSLSLPWRHHELQSVNVCRN